jgi:hypothetical protein
MELFRAVCWLVEATRNNKVGLLPRAIQHNRCSLLVFERRPPTFLTGKEPRDRERHAIGNLDDLKHRVLRDVPRGFARMEVSAFDDMYRGLRRSMTKVADALEASPTGAVFLKTPDQ